MVPRTASRIALGAAVVALALACGGGGDTTAPPPFPAVAGTYRVDITFTGLPSSLANGTGTITFTQASRNDGALGATANIVVLVSSTTATLTTVRNASVTAAGAVRFQLVPPNTTSTWGFDGQLAGGGATMSGTHVLIGSTSSTPGIWTATRQ
jgi:hypothetical protein